VTLPRGTESEVFLGAGAVIGTPRFVAAGCFHAGESSCRAALWHDVRRSPGGPKPLGSRLSCRWRTPLQPDRPNVPIMTQMRDRRIWRTGRRGTAPVSMPVPPKVHQSQRRDEGLPAKRRNR